MTMFRTKRNRKPSGEITALPENIKTLPDSIGNLAQLERFDIEGKSFLSLPETIGNLSNLTKLYLYNTRIKTLPGSIENLVNLSTLQIFSSPIEHDLDAIDYPDYDWDEETEKKSPLGCLPDKEAEEG